MAVAMYPGTFDPIHAGHFDVIERAAAIFERLIVAVASGEGVKSPLFSLAERLELVGQVVARLPNVAVADYSGLTVLFARQRGATVMLRGIRTDADLDFELPLAHMNGTIAPDLGNAFHADQAAIRSSVRRC
ncbi:MAG: pantetheine-phosphate adenylyltransferase [Chloroflexia bacterium]